MDLQTSQQQLLEECEQLLPYATTAQAQKLRAVIQHGGINAAARSGVDRRSIQRAIGAARLEAARKGWAPKHDMTHTVPDGFHIKGTSTLYKADGQVAAQWVKSQKDQEDDLARIEEILADRFADQPARTKIPKPKATLVEDLLPVYMISDAHIGMYSWGEETGGDWDLPIARRMITGAVRYLVDAAPAAKQCLIVNIGDFFHADNLKNQTPAGGHPLDVDTRWSKVVDVGAEAMIANIDFALEKHETVNVESLPGNHDPHAGVMLAIVLRKAYRNNPRVLVGGSPAAYRYFRFGKVLLGMTHGDSRVKPSELPLIMATDRSEDWGESKHRYWYTGHVHHQRKFEPTGSNCTVESFRIMAPRDGWHAKEGYRAGREMQCIVHHKDYGESSRNIVTPDMLRDA